MSKKIKKTKPAAVPITQQVLWIFLLMRMASELELFRWINFSLEDIRAAIGELIEEGEIVKDEKHEGYYLLDPIFWKEASKDFDENMIAVALNMIDFKLFGKTPAFFIDHFIGDYHHLLGKIAAMEKDSLQQDGLLTLIN